MIRIFNVSDSTFLHTFITTYRSFTTPHQLFQKLKERYAVPDPKRASAVQFRVLVALKYWMSTQIHDFDDALVSNIKKFLDNEKTTIAEQVKKELDEKVIIGTGSADEKSHSMM